jgi:hypothetical protein
MPVSNKRFIFEMLRSQYSVRLNEVIEEADVFDEDGDVILSPDLKVRHKDSGYEYTIDHVEGQDGEQVQIHLRSPETPRVVPPAEEKSLLDDPGNEDILGEQDPTVKVSFAGAINDESSQEETIFVIDQEEFEKEYEVD